MSLMTGNQLKAARMLVGLNQAMLAEAAGVNVNTIRKMEARGPDILVSGLDTVRRVEAALRDHGVDVIGAEPDCAGVRLRTGVAALAPTG